MNTGIDLWTQYIVVMTLLELSTQMRHDRGQQLRGFYCIHTCIWMKKQLFRWWLVALGCCPCFLWDRLWGSWGDHLAVFNLLCDNYNLSCWRDLFSANTVETNKYNVLIKIMTKHQFTKLAVTFYSPFSLPALSIQKPSVFCDLHLQSRLDVEQHLVLLALAFHVSVQLHQLLL